MGCVQSTAAGQGDNKQGSSSRSRNGPPTPRRSASGGQKLSGKSRSKSDAREQEQKEAAAGGERKNVFDMLALNDLEIVVKDPERLGLSRDFNEQHTEPPREFTLDELAEITNDFDESYCVGEGGFGMVYHAKLKKDDGSGEYQEVAIKKLNHEGMQGFNEWLTEVIFLRRLRHPHLVGFVGYCSEEEQGVLVYEFMPMGSLDYHLFSETDNSALTWEQRIKVALGAAKGLAYLHEGTGRPVIFRDLKAANILLDKDYNAKLSDFGLARDGPSGSNTHVSTKVVGTYGYTAPEYMQTGHLTAKSDVYAFGVVLLELLSGRRAMDDSRPWDERNLAFWAKPYLADKKKLPQLMDPRLGNKYPQKAAQKLAVAASCCLLDSKSRPSMVNLVQILAAIKELGEKGNELQTKTSLDAKTTLSEEGEKPETIEE